MKLQSNLAQNKANKTNSCKLQLYTNKINLIKYIYIYIYIWNLKQNKKNFPIWAHSSTHGPPNTNKTPISPLTNYYLKKKKRNSNLFSLTIIVYNTPSSSYQYSLPPVTRCESMTSVQLQSKLNWLVSLSHSLSIQASRMTCITFSFTLHL